MSSVLIVANQAETARQLKTDLSGWGFECLTAGIKDKIVERVVRDAPELIVLEMDGQVSQAVLKDLTDGSKIRRKVFLIVLMTAEMLNHPGDNPGIDDFVVRPYDSRELVVRARRLLQRNLKENELLRCEDLVIDLANCEVRVGGKIVELTFKEYELLKFLAKERGRVFSRETLLNKVWGYDYFGGDRTVDVHIRRLRSKIEISDQTFIETVRNIGYRFRKGN
ncbi:MAG: response regulator transcription factor [Dehalococcoidales bacterium]|nr:response regulator transcription factor [Dehalococcoidales bacterium]